MFKKGDLVIAKPEFLDPKEKLLDTAGIVVEYNPDNDYLGVGVLNPEDYALSPIFNGRGSCYEVVSPGSARAYEIEHNELEKKLAKAQKILHKKQDEVNVVYQQIRDLEARKSLEQLKKRGIQEDARFVGFTRTPDYHCILVTLIKINKVSKTGGTINCLAGNYRVDDGEYSYTISQHGYTKSSFEALSEKFELLSINDVAYVEINKVLTNLDVAVGTLENLKAKIKALN